MFDYIYTMKLYNVQDETMVRILGATSVAPGSPEIKDGDVIYFRNIDGMFSYCKRGDDVCHPAAWTDVEIVDG